MATLVVKRHVEAPPETVFRAVAEPQCFAEAIQGVTRIEFLSATTSGAGTRYRQSRSMNDKQYTMDFEITEFVPSQRVRIVNETHGTVWDSVFTLLPSGGGTDLTMRMETQSKPLLARIMMPLVTSMIRGAVEKDLDAVKSYCERSASAARS
jgi:carbon monoxide dehydrogenase subunit G